MNQKLKNILTVSSGQTFREKVNNDPSGGVWVIQMKDLNESYNALAQTPCLVSEGSVSNNQLLQKGDVLFLAKGNYNKAFVFKEDHPAVVVSLFFVLRVDKSKVLPEYLIWFLNQSDTQNILKSTREGTTVSSIKKSALENLIIPVPSMEEQRRIAMVYALHLKEQSMTKELLDKKERLIDALLINRVK